MPLCLTQPVHRALQNHPDRAATRFGARERSWREFGERVARLAAALRHCGLQPGDRVGILGLNSDRYLEAMYGAWWAGGATNPVNFRWSAAEVAYSLDDCDTHILLVDEAFRHLLPELHARSKALQTVIYFGDASAPDGAQDYEALLAAHAPAPDANCGGSTLAAVMYTGGTTGFPKGVMLSHDNVACNALALVAHDVVQTDSRTLIAAPMFHVAAGVVMHGTVHAGGTCVIVPQFSPQGVLEAIEQQRVSATVLVPTMMQLAVDHPDARLRDLSSLRSVGYGASVISAAVLQRAMALFSNAGFHQLYGMTELAPFGTYLGPDDHRAAARKPELLRAAGKASLITEVRIVDGDGIDVPRGAVGELIVRGPGVMLGYWGKPDATAAALRDGWMHTGDGGYRDEDGYIYIVDRMKDMIVTGGENVYSAEVENALASHPAVATSAVIGVPSEQWGESVHAVVVLKPGASAGEAELIEHCRAGIAGYKVPRSVEFRSTLPVTGAGKVQKTELRKPHWAGRQRAI